ncbi:hypothetical protein RMCBS344292_08751 [Rhizopus microsporus]|nr:hypothetical protein RMCBS344292_08751 [Rhizopus microsporus]
MQNSNNKELYFSTKQDCHYKTAKAFEEWSHVLRQTIRMSTCYDELETTTKSFTSVDILAKTTRNHLERTEKALKLLSDKQSDLLFISQEFDDIDNLLNVEQIIKGQTTI